METEDEPSSNSGIKQDVAFIKSDVSDFVAWYDATVTSIQLVIPNTKIYSNKFLDIYF